MSHTWLSGQTATDHNLLPELKAFRTRGRLRRAIELIKLKNRIEKLKEHEGGDPGDSEMGDVNAGGDKFHALGLFAVQEARQKQETQQLEEELEKGASRHGS